MSMITGIGDEVVEVAFVLVFAAIATLAWWSTAATPGRFQTVIVMERTTRNNPHHLTLVGRNISSIRRHLLRNTSVVPAASVPLQPASTDWQEEIENSSEQRGSDASITASREEEGLVETMEHPVVSEQAQEMDSIVDAMDADTALRNRRLNFIIKPGGDADTSSTSQLSTDKQNESQNSSQSVEPDASRNVLIGSGSPASTEANEVYVNETNNEASNTGISESSQKINIKLKFLNDTFREVDGDPDELLKDFKWRHFSSELSRQLRVLLIFNGHVLSEESSSLRACGLYHNCVVHCLVQTPRQPRTAPPTVEPAQTLPDSLGLAGAGNAPQGTPTGTERAGWDMENILMTLVSIILTIIWFFRCEYSNLFTAAASGALFALTLFYSVAIFGLYFSDTFNLTDRRNRDNEQAQRQPHGAVLT